MQSSLSLPNELLHYIIEYIAYTPPVPPGHASSKSLFKRASRELLELSVVDWRLRRACLPFLFANIKVLFNRDATNFKNYIALFSRFTKVLVIGSHSISGAGDQIMSQMIPQLAHLFFVELCDSRLRTDLLKTMLAHPTVASILVNDLPDESICNDDLSKIISGYQNNLHAFSPRFQLYSDRGMRLACLKLCDFDSHSLDSRLFSSRSLQGLEKIQVNQDADPLSPSLLSELSSIHPNLNECWLLEYELFRRRSSRQRTPFLSFFLEESQKQNLKQFFSIEEVGLHRSSGRPSHEWYVMALTLKITCSNASLLETLTLAASSFPKLKFLTLDLDSNAKAVYDISDLASVFARFSCLRVLYFCNVIRWISFEPTNLPSVQQMEHKVSLLTGCLAKTVKTLDSFHIDEHSHKGEKLGPCTDWSLQAWLHVLDSSREVGGTLLITNWGPKLPELEP
ncbi:hypothetical protein EV360DRAFT_83233 [Lentinula raphanica]|nr:hypothetical protein EV360DRAFT_83233 [Lentinula raphanica]